MTNRVWVVDDDKNIRWVLEKTLARAQLQVTCFDHAQAILDALKDDMPDLLMSDIRMPDMDGLELLTHVQALYPTLPVIIMTAYSDLDSTVAAYQGGAFEYLAKPFDVNEASDLVQRAIAHANKDKQPAHEEQVSVSEIIGSAPAMQNVFRAIGRLSRSHMNVLITGESGSGKELVAQALHRHSPRASAPFIALNTAAIPKELLESELFGHERGAFTGALKQNRGRFEQADSGTLFLDEIGDMPAELQTRLLRVLADGTFFRVGGHTPIKVDVRIIAATHQNLKQGIEAGLFREDLYHRLNVINIDLPALRQRREDIPVLIQHFLQEAAQEMGEETKQVSAEAMDYLAGLAWSGNVRQLKNVCRWLTVMAVSPEILIEDLPEELRHTGNGEYPKEDWESLLRQWVQQQLQQHPEQNDLLEIANPRFEKILLETVLVHTQGHKQDAAKRLGWGRNTLSRKIKELGIILPES